MTRPPVPPEFCTIVDEAYLARAVVLHRSLIEVCGRPRLRVLCADDASAALLPRLELPGVSVVTLAELEEYDEGLRAVRPLRTHREYCWTAKPSLCRYALEREPSLAAITFLDADLRFFHDPAPLFDELGEGSVLIVPHRYTEERRQWAREYGVYNSQLVTFRRDDHGELVLGWWRERCLEWCHERVEDGRYGDQKHMDDWPHRFRGVQVLAHPGGGLAPWNSGRYELSRRSSGVFVEGRPVVFYHFASLELLGGFARARRLGAFPRRFRLTRGSPPLVWRTSYPLSPAETAWLWDPYVRCVWSATNELRRLAPSFDGLVAVRGRDVFAPAVRELLPARGRTLLGSVRRSGRRARRRRTVSRA